MIYLIFKSSANKLEANWPAIAFAGTFVITAKWIAESWGKSNVRKLFAGHHIFAFALSTIILSQAAKSWMPIPEKHDITLRYHKYAAIAEDFKEYYETEMDKKIRIVSVIYQLPAYINIYVKPELEAICININDYHPTAFDIWYSNDDLKGKDFYFIHPGSSERPRFFDLFDEVKKIQVFGTTHHGKQIAHYTLYYCKNYAGNDRYFTQ